MKKIFLILALGIFLISLVSAEVIITANTTRPHFNLELRECNGGETPMQENTNYYFQCFMGNYGYHLYLLGPASEEFNVTTNSTHLCMNMSGYDAMCDSYAYLQAFTSNLYGVHCRYSINKSFKDWGGEGYLPASWNNNESYSGTPYWMARVGSPGGYCNSNMKCLSNVDYLEINNDSLKCSTYGYINGAYLRHPEISIPKSRRDNLEESGYNVTQGQMLIEINGTSTWDDLMTALTDSGLTGLYKKEAYSGLSFIGGISCGDGDSINISTKHVNQMFSTIKCDGLDFNTGSTYKHEVDYGSSWWDPNFQIHDSTMNLFSLSTGILDDVIAENLFLTFAKVTYYESFDGITFNTYKVAYLFLPYWTSNETASNSVLNGLYVYDTPRPTDDSINYAFFYNDTFNNYGEITYDIRVYLGYTAGNTNAKVYRELYNTVSDRPDKKVKILYVPASSYPDFLSDGNEQNFSFYFDVRFNIKDENGNSIENANITLYNDYNIYTGLTNPNGYLMLTPLSYKNQYAYGESYGEEIDTKEYNLTITATNYKDYSTQVNITEPQDWTIALESRDWNYSQSLAWKILNSTKTTILKLSDDGKTGDLYLVKELMEVII